MNTIGCGFLLRLGCDIACSGVQDDGNDGFRAFQTRFADQPQTTVIASKQRNRHWSAWHLWHWSVGADASGQQNYKECNRDGRKTYFSRAHPARIDHEWKQLFVRQTRCDAVSGRNCEKQWNSYQKQSKTSVTMWFKLGNEWIVIHSANSRVVEASEVPDSRTSDKATFEKYNHVHGYWHSLRQSSADKAPKSTRWTKHIDWHTCGGVTQSVQGDVACQVHEKVVYDDDRIQIPPGNR